MNLLKKQRDAVGLSLFGLKDSDYFPEKKNSSRHHALLLDRLRRVLSEPKFEKNSRFFEFLHKAAERLHKRSMVVLFSDMLSPDMNLQDMSEAFRHLKYKKHEVVLFHVLDRELEINLNFRNAFMLSMIWRQLKYENCTWTR